MIERDYSVAGMGPGSLRNWKHYYDNILPETLTQAIYNTQYNALY